MACFNGLYYEYLRSSKKRKKDFELTREQFRELTSNNCFYCNKPPSKIYYKPNCNGEYLTWQEMQIAMKAILNYRGNTWHQ